MATAFQKAFEKLNLAPSSNPALLRQKIKVKNLTYRNRPIPRPISEFLGEKTNIKEDYRQLIEKTPFQMGLIISAPLVYATGGLSLSEENRNLLITGVFIDSNNEIPAFSCCLVDMEKPSNMRSWNRQIQKADAGFDQKYLNEFIRGWPR